MSAAKLPMSIRDTKERALPEHAAQTLEDYLVYLKHVAMYEFARTRFGDKIILDLGCGEGYGASELARTARWVVAADANFDAVAHAARRYSDARLAFVVCDAQSLPFRSSVFDAIVSYEVIEHIPNVTLYLAEIHRLAHAPAKVFISTPNRRLRLLPFQKPWNRYHLREYAPADFAATLQRIFPRVRILGVSAIEPILQIEKRRVKQNPLIAYPRMIAQWLVPPAAYVELKKINPPASGKAMPASNRGKYSADDFQITSDKLGECINMLALCETDE